MSLQGRKTALRLDARRCGNGSKRRRLKLEELEVRVAPTSLLFGMPLAAGLWDFVSSSHGDGTSLPPGASDGAAQDGLPLTAPLAVGDPSDAVFSPGGERMLHPQTHEGPAPDVISSEQSTPGRGPSPVVFYGVDSPDLLPAGGEAVEHSSSNPSGFALDSAEYVANSIHLTAPPSSFGDIDQSHGREYTDVTESNNATSNDVNQPARFPVPHSAPIITKSKSLSLGFNFTAYPIRAPGLYGASRFFAIKPS